MLAWIANSAPERLKATYFAVMASFTNLALSASQLLTKYLNQIYVVTREVQGCGHRGGQRCPPTTASSASSSSPRRCSPSSCPSLAIALVEAAPPRQRVTL